MPGLFDFKDPDNLALSGLIQGLVQGGGPSRVPVPFGAALGMGLQGMQQGRVAMDEGALRKLELQEGGQTLANNHLKIIQAYAQQNYYLRKMGQPEISLPEHIGSLTGATKLPTKPSTP